MQDDTAGYAEKRDENTCREGFRRGQQETRQHVFFDNDTGKGHQNIGRHGDDETIDNANAN